MEPPKPVAGGFGVDELAKLIRLTHVAGASAAVTKDTNLDEATVSRLHATLQILHREIVDTIGGSLADELATVCIDVQSCPTIEVLHVAHAQTFAWLQGVQEAVAAGVLPSSLNPPGDPEAPSGSSPVLPGYL